MKQFDDYETSTRVCSCGASITWSGADSRLDEWMSIHAGHDNEPLRSETTLDGSRAYGKRHG